MVDGKEELKPSEAEQRRIWLKNREVHAELQKDVVLGTAKKSIVRFEAINGEIYEQTIRALAEGEIADSMENAGIDVSNDKTIEKGFKDKYTFLRLCRHLTALAFTTEKESWTHEEIKKLFKKAQDVLNIGKDILDVSGWGAEGQKKAQSFRPQ